MTAPDPIDIDHLDALYAAATPGEWAQGDNWCCAGTHPPCDPERTTCAYCDDNPPSETWPATAADIAEGKDPRTVWHRHRSTVDSLKPTIDDDGTVLFRALGVHRIEGPTGVTVAGNYDYEAGGIIRDEDAKLIVALHNAWPASSAELRRLRAENEKLRANNNSNNKEDGKRRFLSTMGSPCAVANGWLSASSASRTDTP